MSKNSVPNVLVFDTEWNGFRDTADKMWVYYDCTHTWTPGNYPFKNAIKPSGIQKAFNSAEYVVGHNIINYDLPLLKKWYGITVNPKKVIDTLVWSHLFFPDLKVPDGWVGKPAPHSLEAWGMRLGGLQKTEIQDFSQFSPEMIHRCQVDAYINYELFKHLWNFYKTIL